MPKNTGIPYENLAQRIFEQILNQNAVQTIKVEHNVTLQGKTASHQIDVYWEFEMGGIKYSTIVQAKDWNQPVSQGELFKFKGILEDLPNQPRGIFVTRTGYQAGAKKYADKQGIALYELREPKDEDWDDKIKTIILNLHSFFPEYKDVKLNHDNDWAIQERQRLNTPRDALQKIQIYDRVDRIIFVDDNNNQVETVKSVIDTFYPQGFQEMPPTGKTHVFGQATYVQTNVPAFPRLKILSLEATVSVSALVQEIRIDAQDVVGFILKNVIEGTQVMFDKNAKLRS